MAHVLAFSGPSGSGKTTLLTRIASILARSGVRVGVVKHHGHGGRPINPPGKDSHAYIEAGALAVTVTGPGEAATFHAQPGDPGPQVAAAAMTGLDLVLAEGFKSRSGWKVEVVPPGGKPQLTGDPLLLALAGRAADRPPDSPVRWLDIDDPQAAAEFVRANFNPPDRLGPVPDRETCFGLMARYAMLPNILVHSLVVAETAMRLGAALVRAGRDLDLPMVEAGGLTHDIAKTECLIEKCPHSERGFQIMLALGYPGLAKVIRDHIDPAEAIRKRGLISPSLVVNYADKRVLHAKVVPAAERAADLIERYGDTPERKAWLTGIVEYAIELEKQLFDQMVDLAPEDLNRINDMFAGVE